MLLQLHQSPAISIGSAASAVPVAQGVAMLKPPEAGRSRKEQAVDEVGSTPPVESAEQAKAASLETPDAGEARLIEALKQRDREVRAHEQAHAAMAGPFASGGPVYEYQRGPDGRYYAIGGHVSLDTSPVHGDPQATLDKAERLRRAALAPAQPSAQDRQVAAQVNVMALNARAEIQAEAIEAATRTDSEESDRSRDAETAGETPQAEDLQTPDSATAEADTTLSLRIRATGALPESESEPHARLEVTA